MTKHFEKTVMVPACVLRLATALLLVASGCSSRAKSTGADEKSATSAGPAQTIDVNCLGDRLDNPPEAFHYSYKTTGSQNDVDKEADVTPQTMDITVHDNSGSHAYHGDRSKESSWNSAVLDLSGSGLTTMTAGSASSRTLPLYHAPARSNPMATAQRNIPSTPRERALQTQNASQHCLAGGATTKARCGSSPKDAR